jgi:hypothetical protein
MYTDIRPVNGLIVSSVVVSAAAEDVLEIEYWRSPQKSIPFPNYTLIESVKTRFYVVKSAFPAASYTSIDVIISKSVGGFSVVIVHG